MEFNRLGYLQPIGGGSIWRRWSPREYLGKKSGNRARLPIHGERVEKENVTKGTIQDCKGDQCVVTETKLVKRSKAGIVHSGFFYRL